MFKFDHFDVLNTRLVFFHQVNSLGRLGNLVG